MPDLSIQRRMLANAIIGGSMSSCCYFQRRISLPSKISDSSARLFIYGLNSLSKESSVIIEGDYASTIIKNPPMFIEINSDGGCIYSAQYIINHMLSLQQETPIVTINMGLAASASAWISLFGSPGLRTCIKNCFYLLHPISVYFSEPQTHPNMRSSVDAMSLFMKGLLERLLDHLAPLKLSNEKIEKIKLMVLSEKDSFYTAEQMKEVGLVDNIIEPYSIYNFSQNVIMDIFSKKIEKDEQIIEDIMKATDNAHEQVTEQVKVNKKRKGRSKRENSNS